jgi:hypothetical protein
MAQQGATNVQWRLYHVIKCIRIMKRNIIHSSEFSFISLSKCVSASEIWICTVHYETLTWGNMTVADFLPGCLRTSDWHNVVRVPVSMDIAVFLSSVNNHKRLVNRRRIHSCTGPKQTVLMAASLLRTCSFPCLSNATAVYSCRLPLFSTPILALQSDRCLLEWEDWMIAIWMLKQWVVAWTDTTGTKF